MSWGWRRRVPHWAPAFAGDSEGGGNDGGWPFGKLRMNKGGIAYVFRRLRVGEGGGLRSPDVCLGEVLAFVEEGFSGHFREGVGEAIAEVEGGCGVVALAKPSPGVSGDGDLFGGEGDDFDGLALKECIEFLAACRAQSAFQNDSGFKNVERGHTETIHAEQRFFEIGAVSLSQQDGADGR